MRKSTILSFILFFVLLSCSKSTDAPTAAFTPRNIPFTLIGKDYMISPGPTNILPQNTVITNQTQWAGLLTQMDSNSNVSNSFSTTTIDFNLYNLVVIIDIVRPNLSYAITINSITDNQNNITVNISTSGSMVGYNAASQPYHIVRIPKQTQPFVFQ